VQDGDVEEPGQVRAAVAADVEGLVQLAARRREQYHQYQPRFWQPADDASEMQRRFFHALIDDEAVAVLVVPGGAGDLQGFAVARTVDAPPVYDPRGPTCLVDDFTVSDDAEWPRTGALLLEAVSRWAGCRGATQLVVVTAHLDEAKRRLLRRSELSLASEWWVGEVHRPD
jgi:GNAT superfamily N-acetyltransferase